MSKVSVRGRYLNQIEPVFVVGFKGHEGSLQTALGSSPLLSAHYAVKSAARPRSTVLLFLKKEGDAEKKTL